MSIPVWVLLLFALWTLLLLIVSVGVYRLGRIYTGKTTAREYAFPDLDQSDWHRRATRAHLNCVENLPIYGAIVLAIVVSGSRSPMLDLLAEIFLASRVIQSLIQLSFTQTGRVTMYRFMFYVVQLICMIWMGVLVIQHRGLT